MKIIASIVYMFVFGSQDAVKVAPKFAKKESSSDDDSSEESSDDEPKKVSWKFSFYRMCAYIYFNSTLLSFRLMVNAIAGRKGSREQ